MTIYFRIGFSNNTLLAISLNHKKSNIITLKQLKELEHNQVQIKVQNQIKFKLFFQSLKSKTTIILAQK